MRKEIVWNAGLHSHPECLNKLPVNGAANGEEQETTIKRTDRDVDHPGRESHQDVFMHVVVIYNRQRPIVYEPRQTGSHKQTSFDVTEVFFFKRPNLADANLRIQGLLLWC